MKRSVNRLLPVIFAGMFVYAGCANQEVVKRDEPLVPATTKPLGATSANSTDKALAARDTKSSLSSGDGLDKSQLKNVQNATGHLRNAFENIYFDLDSTALNNAARQALVKNFAVIKQISQAKIRVEGNCDERGSAEYNLALGERRAQAAVHYLTTMGVQADRLSFISYGKEKPADPGHDEAAWAKNRRDEFVISR